MMDISEEGAPKNVSETDVFYDGLTILERKHFLGVGGGREISELSRRDSMIVQKKIWPTTMCKVGTPPPPPYNPPSPENHNDSSFLDYETEYEC